MNMTLRFYSVSELVFSSSPFHLILQTSELSHYAKARRSPKAMASRLVETEKQDETGY
jgi:hypothetical protein